MNRRRILLFLGFVLLVGVVFAFLRRSSEPRYQGHSLSYWYKEYCHPFSGLTTLQDTRRREEALVALRHIGTNALPYLVELAYSTNRDSTTRSNVMNVLDGFRQFWQQPPLVRSATLRGEAAPLLRELKPPANALIPLLQTYSHSTNLAANNLSLHLLGGVGDGVELAVPYLAASLKQPRLASSLTSLDSLEHLGAAARSAVPGLVEFLAALKGTNLVEGLLAGIPGISTNNIPRMASSLKNQWLYSAAKAVGSIGPDAAPAVPLLQEFLETRTNEMTRIEIAFALCRIDPGQTNALGFLVANIGNATNWSMAVQHLGDLGTNALAAAPALLDAVRRPNLPVQLQAARALKKIGVPPNEYLPAIKTILVSNSPVAQLGATAPALGPRSTLAQFGAAAQIMAIDPSDRDALQFLIRNATDNSQLRFSVVRELANAGAANQDAIAALRELLKSIDPRLRSEAAEALKEIEAREPPK